MFQIDETDPRYLIAYDSNDVADISGYRELMRRWEARFDGGSHFGVILVTEAHDLDEDDHEHNYERNVAFEEAFTKLLNDFRRDHKPQIERSTVGYARVVLGGWVEAQVKRDPHYMEEACSSTDRMARYMWGIPGSLFGNVEKARDWLLTQFDNVSAFPTAELTPAHNSHRIGLFYGSTTGVTEAVAHRIQQAWNALGLDPLVAQNVGMIKDPCVLLTYDYLILGIPTWNVGRLQDDWEIAVPQLEQLDFAGKRVALFGVGDQYGYADNFLDAVGILGDILEARGAELIGFYPTDGYEFASSKALRNNQFMGLPLDEVHQPKLTGERVKRWVQQIAHEFTLQANLTA